MVLISSPRPVLLLSRLFSRDTCCEVLKSWLGRTLSPASAHGRSVTGTAGSSSAEDGSGPGASALGLQACGAARVPPLSAARQKADPALFSPRPCSGCSFACGSVAPSSATHRQRWSPEASPTPGDVTRVHSDFLVS
ncbi:hypothetical protein CB1_000568093 [Camelus ferus]|nr:hypothetical protein CB1_000568093 [Camelus ferus]